MTVECQNCGASVSDAYVRVFVPDNATQPRACPHCPDKIRTGSVIRENRNHKSE